MDKGRKALGTSEQELEESYALLRLVANDIGKDEHALWHRVTGLMAMARDRYKAAQIERRRQERNAKEQRKVDLDREGWQRRDEQDAAAVSAAIEQRTKGA